MGRRNAGNGVGGLGAEASMDRSMVGEIGRKIGGVSGVAIGARDRAATFGIARIGPISDEDTEPRTRPAQKAGSSAVSANRAAATKTKISANENRENVTANRTAGTDAGDVCAVRGVSVGTRENGSNRALGRPI